MLLIKRYPNRKLYDTEAKRYVSLDDVARMIRQGTDIQVVDHTTGGDLTTLTLVQVIAEQQKQGSGVLPLPLLQGLVQAGSATLAGLWRGLLSPLDLLQQVDDEIERRVLRLVALGELSDAEGRRLIALLLAVGAASADALVQARVARTIEAQGLATRAEIARLAGLVDELAAEVEALAD